MRFERVVLWCGVVAASLVMISGCASSSTQTARAEESKLPAPPPQGSGTSPKEYLSDFRPIEARGVVMTVHGLGCPLCAENINKSLAGVQGVASSSVDMSTGAVRVEFAEGTSPSRAALARAIVDAGFTLVAIEARA